jgi:FkbM family methyltransferase
MTISLDRIQLDIKGVIHVGAHWGQEYQEYVNRGIKNVMFFEPMKASYKKLVASLPKIKDIRCYNLALGNQTGEVEMFTETENGGQSSSILEPGTHLKMYPKIKFNGRETVKIDRLDNIPFDRSLYNMMMIDTQGFELEVLKGAKKTLKSIECIYVEVNRDEVYKGCPMVEEIDAYLKDFQRMETNWLGGTWGDAVYMRYE